MDRLLLSKIKKNNSQLAEKVSQTNFNNLQSQVNGISASPKGTYATVTDLTTAFPSGNSNVYVVTADGGWYYWNSSAWTKGGTYQSTGIANKSIDKLKFDDNLRSRYATCYSFSDFVADLPTWNLYNSSLLPINNGIPKINGYNAWLYKLNPFLVEVGNKIKLYAKFKINSFTITDLVRISIGVGKYSTDGDIMAYFDLNANGSVLQNGTLITSGYVELEIEDTYTGLISGSPYIEFKMTNQSAITSIDIDIIDCHVIKIPTSDFAYDENNMYGTKYADYAYKSKQTEGLTNDVQDAIITNTINSIKSTYDLESISNPFNGKTWGAIGDSLTASYLDVYVSYIAGKTGMTATNYGIGGTCVAQNASADVTPCFVDRVCGLNGQTGYTDQFDLWTIFGGVNDAIKSTPIGTLTSTDPTTFYGALNLIIQHLQAISNHPLIVLIAPYQFLNNYVTNYRNAIKNIGEAYGLPVIDLYAISQLSTDNRTNANYFLRDGIHPNQYGANLLRPLILKEFKNKIVLPESTDAMPH